MKALVKKGHYPNRQTLQEELNSLVRNNYLYYNSTRAEYKLRGRSMEIGLKRYLKELSLE